MQACDAHERPREAEEALRRAKSAEDSASRRLIDLGSDLAPLRQAGFASWAEVQESLLDEDEMSALEAEIAEHETLERLVEEGQRQGRDDMIAPRADPAQADLMRQLLSHAEEISRERHRRQESRLAMLDRILDALDGLAADLERIESAAGLATPSRGGAFEERAREALSSRVLERAEARLVRRRRPWELRWEGEPSALRLRVRHAGTGEPVSDEEISACGDLALALAIELALAGEPVGLGMIVVEGIDELPPGDEGMVLVRG